ncbi:MAG TPA: phosphoglycolate phosphatase [Dongiaceae bacterium]|nr:phosphoglycolate phosphatase [Dongiaceae bacterium]
MKMPQKRHIVVFDLDGTLVDSAPDIAGAANDTLTELGAAPLSLAAITRMIGDGAPKLMERALSAAGLTLELADVMPRFMQHYDAHATRLVKPYPGVVETLAQLTRNGYRLGVCTNKPYQATLMVLEACNLAAYFSACIGGDSLPQRKPQAEPLLAAIAQLQGTPDQAVMVGDSATDLATAVAAGIPALIIPSGYGVETVAATPGFDSFADLPRLLHMLPSGNAPQGAFTGG